MNKDKNKLLFLVIFTALTLLFSTTVTATEQEESLTVVSLGDSITFGWNLEQPQTPPVQSENAFPFLIGNGNTEVLNVSYPGWTSTQLLEAIKTVKAKQMLQQAETVTLSIGANDLLQAIELSKIIENQQPVDPEALQQKVTAATAQVYNNITEIITLIKEETDAPILLYSLYNPFGINDPIYGSIHTLGEMITNSVNSKVYSTIAAQQGVHYLDAYSAFNGKQQDYIIPGDIHPTISGQQALAQLATNLLNELIPITINPILSTVEETTEPVSISLEEIEHTIEIKWLTGEKTIADFVNEGNLVENNSFTVSENGVYTIYVKTALGESVYTFEISTITPKAEEPVEEEEPPVDVEQPEEEEPPSDTTDEDEAPAERPEKETQDEAPKVEKPKQTMVKSGHALPDTATSMYNILLTGLCFIGIGGGVLFNQRLRKSKVKQ
ncbi:SGNH/GDSL hydrolase family protein [Metabacillus litoralis]|uniref:SGNH/GDSL hydrolase family protein n=1 Tax=Metabacillus litoralis TaxID=152268 RepID=UPI0013CF05B5|nr:GDSL-type esterase/lipase family protein [Metabacillus litoralis]